MSCQINELVQLLAVLAVEATGNGSQQRLAGMELQAKDTGGGGVMLAMMVAGGGGGAGSAGCSWYSL
jgi:hypothetical protein